MTRRSRSIVVAGMIIFGIAVAAAGSSCGIKAPPRPPVKEAPAVPDGGGDAGR